MRLGVRAPQGMRSMGPLEGVLSPLVEEPPPRREGRNLLALLGGFLDALIVAACNRLHHRSLLAILYCIVAMFATLSWKGMLGRCCTHAVSCVTYSSVDMMI